MSTTKIFLELEDQQECLDYAGILQAHFQTTKINTFFFVHGIAEAYATKGEAEVYVVIVDIALLTAKRLEKLLSINGDIKIIGVDRVFNPDTAELLNGQGACGYFTHQDNRIIVLDLIEKVLRLKRAFGRYEFQVSIQ